MVNVYENGDVISRVKYNSNLDMWDGRNWTNGGTGLHKGLTRLRDGRYVLIHGTQWQGSNDYAEIISEDEALQEILRANCEELFEDKRFKDLKKLMESELVEEMEE